ncbi:hypothetical protein L9G15_21305, partial [Shewanella sp. A3A]|nr:hypothetical protein [Shewanella ferrihydritica]
AGLSKFLLLRLFKQAARLSSAQYQRHARLNEARRRLREKGQYHHHHDRRSFLASSAAAGAGGDLPQHS